MPCAIVAASATLLVSAGASDERRARIAAPRRLVRLAARIERRDEIAVREVLPLVEAALAPFSPRPHWGKLFLYGPAVLAPNYPKIAAYRALVERVDPDAKFRSTFVDYLVFGAPLVWNSPMGRYMAAESVLDDETGDDAAPFPSFGWDDDDTGAMLSPAVSRSAAGAPVQREREEALQLQLREMNRLEGSDEYWQNAREREITGRARGEVLALTRATMLSEEEAAGAPASEVPPTKTD